MQEKDRDNETHPSVEQNKEETGFVADGKTPQKLTQQTTTTRDIIILFVLLL